MTVLITGASSGIGLASAVRAAQAGLTTVATVRELRRAAALREAAAKAEVAVDIVELDVTQEASVAACIRTVIDRYGRLDALVNNAGIVGSNPTLEVADLADLRACMEVNFFGTLTLSAAAMPHLRLTGGRLITISSVRGVIGQPFNEGYSAAKFAIEGFMEALAPVAARVGVSVCLVEPAAVLDTGLVDRLTPSDARWPEQAGPYLDAFLAYRQWVRTGAIEAAQLSVDVAEVVVRTLAGPPPPLRMQTSDYARRYVAHKLVDPNGTAIQALTGSWLDRA